MLVATVVLAWLFPVLALSLVLWSVVEAGWRWSTALRRADRPSADSDAIGQPIQLLSAAALLGFGLAMTAFPDVGETVAEPSTLARLAISAWSLPVGLVLIAVSAVGLRAGGKVRRQRRTAMTDREPPVTV